MLIKLEVQRAIARGEVNLAFRRWKRPTVKTGGQLRTSVGVLAIDDVRRVDETEISAAEAHQAGFESRQELLAELNKRPGGALYRIEVHLSEPDPRTKLRQNEDLTPEDVAEIDGLLSRFDQASPQGPWTERTIQLVNEMPATRAPDLAAAAGFETKWFKTKVRKLKELGLTESLEIGYKLSPRGYAYLRLRLR